MAATTRVYTLAHVVEMLGEDEDGLHGLTGDMFLKGGCLWNVGVGEDGGLGLADFGILDLPDAIREARN